MVVVARVFLTHVVMIRFAIGISVSFLLIACGVESTIESRATEFTTENQSTSLVRVTPIPTQVPTSVATDAVGDSPIWESLQTPTGVVAGESFVPQAGKQTLGQSVQGRPIDVWQFGNGQNQIVLVGGIHGGYEWNTIELAYQFIDYYAENGDKLPENIALSVIPSSNPDGQAAVMGDFGRIIREQIADNIVPGRLNANRVDLNRNWDCEWQSDAVWQTVAVSGGTAPFSEPESVVLKEYIVNVSPFVVIFFHSAADGVYTGQCEGKRHYLTDDYAKIYSEQANYQLNTEFSAYKITGDASDYLNKIDIPSFTVELSNHEASEWTRNKKALDALIDRVASEGGK